MSRIKHERYTYSAFELGLSSEIELPGFMECERPADVSIVFGKVPQSIKNANIQKTSLQISPRELYFKKGRTKFLISNGCQIIIETPGKPNNAVIKTYLTGVCMSAILLQRGFVPIHGSCVVIDGRCVIFTGPSGAGKSSLCYAFQKEQYEFLSDEISAIYLNDSGELLVLPAHPHQRLCRSTVRKMGYKPSDSSEKACDGKVVIHSRQQFRNEPVRLSAIFELKKGKGEVNSIKVTGTEKLRSIINNINYVSVLTGMGISMDYFLKCAEIANNVDYYLLKRPQRGDSTGEQIQHVVNILTGSQGTT